ncbi:GGDEF domain-containing protein [Psychromonas sp.]|uniref:GGDEF domain-containing protein n=1 Tax=Psychromonas sp. TaxID=1884585 RepID=UPI0039E3680E
MSSFRWDTYFVTGIENVDKQHFYLVGLINKFADLLAQNELQFDDIESVFQELKEYTVYHFRAEEKMMEDVGIDPRFYNQHITAHLDFLFEVTYMHDQMSAKNITLARQLLDFLIHWLVYHILGMDQNMARQVEAIKKGCTADQAYQAERTEIDSATEALLSALSGLFSQVSERNKELLELNQTLELKVQQRTQALLEANQELEQLAITDVLTLLPNRRYGMDHLSALWEKSEQENTALSCLMIDIDHFKAVNDTYGHDAGDKVLFELSQQLQQTLRTDDIVCRLGGDEFLVICEKTDFAGAMHLARLLCDALAQLKVDLGQSTWLGSVSIGVATKQNNMEYIKQLIKMADQGVYLAKQAGKGCVKSIQA